MDSAIYSMHRSGASLRKIKSECHVGYQRIYDVISAFNNQETLDHKIGRPSVLNDNILEKINIITIFDGNIDDQSVCQLLKKDNICISRATVNRCRKKLGFKYKPKIKIQKLSNDHVDRRLDLIDYVSKEQISVDNLLFSDESRFCLNGDRDYTWRKRGVYNKSSFQEQTKFSDSIMVWGCIGVGFKSPLIIFNSFVNSETYTNSLINSGFYLKADEIYGKYNWQLVQDGAPPHVTESTLFSLREHFNIFPLWPPNSCDLNPIETLWGAMKKRLKQRNIKNHHDLIKEVTEIWDSFDQFSIDRLVLSFKNRIQLLDQSKGYSIQPFVSNSHNQVPEYYSKQFANPNHSPWTEDEDDKILELVNTIGHKWTVLQYYFGTLKRKPPYCEGVSIFLKQKNSDSCGFICYIFGLVK